jgi:hypothetical protein
MTKHKTTDISQIEFLSNTENQEGLINTLSEHLSTIKIDNQIEISNLYTQIFDFSLPTVYLIKALEKYCELNTEESLSVINKLNSIYLYSYSKLIEDYLYLVATQSNIDPILRLECAKVLTVHKDIGYHALNKLCSIFHTFPNLATPYKVESICMLMLKEDYKHESLKYICDIINDNNIEALYRYKIILSIKIKVEDEDKAKFFTEKSCISFLSNFENPITFRVLACQYTLIYCKPSEELREWIEDQLLTFASQEDLDINVRADATDVLLQLGSEEKKKIAGEIILFLGTNGARGRTIFDNSQNVHQKAIEESALKILEFLNTLPIKEGVDYDLIRKEILEEIGKEENKETYSCEFIKKVESALTRILIDRAVYSRYHLSLINILVKIWTYISTHQYSQDMKKRLIDELFESSEVCSTGYAFRIVNVISGYGDLSIQISFEDQIISYLATRLNKKVMEIEDEEIQSLILNEMMINPSQFQLRSNFLKFFRDTISFIREDMYQEFREYMSDSDYDLYFRKAIFKYEGMLD